MQQTPDMGYIIAGYREMPSGNYSLWVIKILPDAQSQEPGEVDWQFTYPGEFWTVAGACVQCTTDGGYIVTGATADPSGFSDALLVKTDADGSYAPGGGWVSTFGNENRDDSGRSVRQTSDGGYVIGGVLQTTDTDLNAWLLKVDSSGNKVWDEDFGATTGSLPENLDRGLCAIQSSDGGYVLVGETFLSSPGGDADAWMIKTDSSGKEQWSKTFGEYGYQDWAGCVQQTEDGGYILAGMTRSPSFGGEWEDALLIKTDSAGELQWYQDYGGDADDAVSHVCQTGDGGYVAAGYTNSFSGGFNLYLVYYRP